MAGRVPRFLLFTDRVEVVDRGDGVVVVRVREDGVRLVEAAVNIVELVEALGLAARLYAPELGSTLVEAAADALEALAARAKEAGAVGLAERAARLASEIREVARKAELAAAR